MSDKIEATDEGAKGTEKSLAVDALSEKSPESLSREASPEEDDDTETEYVKGHPVIRTGMNVALIDRVRWLY